MPIALPTLSLVEKAEPVQVRFPLCLGDQWSKKVQDGCEVYMDSFMASNESCFMVAWTAAFENHLLEEGLPQIWRPGTHNCWKPPLGGRPTTNLETTALTIVNLIYFIMCEDLAWVKIYWNSMWLRARWHMTSNYTWGPVTPLHIHDFGSVLGRPLGTSFWELDFHGHVWSGPKTSQSRACSKRKK